MKRIKWQFIIPIIIGIIGCGIGFSNIEYILPKIVYLEMTDVELSSESKGIKYYKGYYKSGDFKISKIVKEGDPALNGEKEKFYEAKGQVMLLGDIDVKGQSYIIVFSISGTMIIVATALWVKQILKERKKRKLLMRQEGSM